VQGSERTVRRDRKSETDWSHEDGALVGRGWRRGVGSRCGEPGASAVRRPHQHPRRGGLPLIPRGAVTQGFDHLVQPPHTLLSHNSCS
jgi:hypothetical protein